MLIHKIKVPEGTPKTRLQDYAFEVFKAYIPSRKGIKKAIKRNRIQVDGKIGNTGDWIISGMEISLSEEIHLVIEDRSDPLEVLYEDDELAVIHKPAGIVVSGRAKHTVQKKLIASLQSSPAKDNLAIPRPVHRLDKATSGCLLVAKTKYAQMYLGEGLSERSIKKFYTTLVFGETPFKGSIMLQIEGKTAISQFTCKQIHPSLSHKWISELEVSPLTGRTHQIRIHCQAMGHPIIGDPLYKGAFKNPKGKGLFLHASKIAFKKPGQKEAIVVESVLPNKFSRYLKLERDRWHKFRSKT